MGYVVAIMKNYLQPWKLATLALGIGLLIAGSYEYQATDWDIGVCLVMAFFTYLSAAWCLRTLLDAYHYRRWSINVVYALIAWWWSVDGCYWLYHTIVGNELIRYENFFASTALYFMCAVLWLPQGGLIELFGQLRGSVRSWRH